MLALCSKSVVAFALEYKREVEELCLQMGDVNISNGKHSIGFFYTTVSAELKEIVLPFGLLFPEGKMMK